MNVDVLRCAHRILGGMWNTPNVIQLSSKENLRYPAQAKLIRYYTAIIFLFLSPILSRKQKLKNIKMPFPKIIHLARGRSGSEC